MNDELLALYTADREERVDQPRMGTPEYTAMRARSAAATACCVLSSSGRLLDSTITFPLVI